MLSCPITMQADELARRLGGENAPSQDELARFHLISAKHMANKGDEARTLLGEQTRCLHELRGSHVHMQGELRDLREVVMQKHAREIEELKSDLGKLRADQDAAQARIKYWVGGAAAVFVVLSNLNLGKLAELVK